MKKLTVATLAGLTMLCGVNVAKADAGDSTVSIGYAQVHSKYLKETIKEYKNESSSSSEDFIDSYPTASPSWGVNSNTDAKGINLKYRYEITDDWGVIGSFTYASQNFNSHYSAIDPETKDYDADKASGKYKYYSFLVGPTHRFNDYVSEYVMVGAAFSRFKGSYSEAYNTSHSDGDVMGYTSINASDKKTQFAYSAGIQINPIKNVAIDVAYEGSGSGDWRTSGFNVGVGYSF